MTINSRLGEGTAVTIRLPVMDPAEHRAPPPEPAEPPELSSPPPLAVAAGDNVIAFRPQR